MVVAMMSGPPKRTLLTTGSSPKSQNKLKEPAGFISAVRKITVIGPRDGEHTGIVHKNAHRNRSPADTRKDGKNSNQMNTHKRNGASPMDLLIFGKSALLSDNSRLRWSLQNFSFNL